MGRSTRQHQQPATQSSSITKRPKDYSKQNLLRKKYTNRELPISTRRSTELNAVMQMDPPGSRRRLGRNPVAEQQQDSSSSPNEADSSNETIPGGSSNSAECRRSSRKKTIKFDVRDLLNKNRKSHKIQIEARIDSNEPKIGAGQVSRAELDSKQKNFIEKSAIFRRYSISENKLPPRPPPPPGALIHTIQQCVGELEQLPLDGGELNLAAISPIARRLSRTQDILTATMMKPKQVSSLIVTKLESASTSKAAEASAIPATSARRRVFGGCEPSTSTEIQKKPQKRGRKPKPKVFTESTTESSSASASASASTSSSLSSSSSSSSSSPPSSSSSSISSSMSSSNDSFDLSVSNRKSGEKKKSKKEDLDAIESKVSVLDENSTTGIDLKENLDASAVTLPPPTILDDSMNNSTDDSFVAAEEDLFTLRSHSSDESTTGSMINSPKGRKIDEISLFGRSNSTETNSSDDSEMRRRKIRIAVKRVSLTPQKSPLGSSFGRITEQIEILSSINDENSNEDAIQNKTKSPRNSLTGKQGETCSSPPINVNESETSNAAPVGSNVIEITSCAGTLNDEPEPSLNTRRGRSCKLTEAFPKPKTLEINFTAIQKSTVPQNIEVSLNSRSSIRKSAPHLPIETIAASSSSISLKYDAQSMENVISPKKDDIVEVEDHLIYKDISVAQKLKGCPTSVQVTQKETEQICEQKSELSEEKFVSQVRSLRSAQSVQVKTPSLAASKRQRKINKSLSPPDNSIEHDTQTQPELLDKEVLPILSNDGQSESVPILEVSLPNERQSPQSKGITNLDSPQSQTSVKQFLSHCKDNLGETDKKLLSESDDQEQLDSSKQTRTKSLRKQDKLDDSNLTVDKVVAKDPTIISEEELELKTDEKTQQHTREQDSKSEIELPVDSTDRSSTDTTISDRRRESLRSRSSVLPTKKETSKKISKAIAKSNTADSSSESSECHDKSPKNCIQIKSAKLIDDKSKEETSSLCSESSSNGSSTSSSSSSSSSTSSLTTSSSTTSSSSSSSSSSTSSSTSSSSSSEGRSTRASRSTKKFSHEQQAQVKAIRTKSPTTPENISKTLSAKSDSECSENFSRTESIKNKLMERRKSTRWHSEHKRDTDESESSDAIQHTSKTRSGRSRGRSRGRFERDEEVTKILHKKPLQQELVASGVELDKIAIDEASIQKNNDLRDELTTNQEAPKIETSLTPRAKSKKRTRRFVPIKYSSSESGSLSDDGNPASQKSTSVRLTRTRRKTISSASEFDEIPSDNLSPPDLALEYLPRKSKQAEVKMQELGEKKDERMLKSKKEKQESHSAGDLKNELNTICTSKTEEEPTKEATSKIVRSKKKTRCVSKCRIGESESDQSSMDSGNKQEVQEPASPSSSVSSSVEGELEVLRQRKVTRLSLKTHSSGLRNNESHTIQKDTIDSSSEHKQSQEDCDLMDEKVNDSRVEAIESVLCISEESCLQNKNILSTSTDVVESVVVPQSMSPKQSKGTKSRAKSPVILRSKQEYKEKIAEKDDETNKPKVAHLEEKGHDEKISPIICSTTYDSLKDNLDNSPNSRKVTRFSPKRLDLVPQIKIQDNLPVKDKQDDVTVQENSDDNLKPTELAKLSGTRKGTRLSMKLIETTNFEKNIKENPDNDGKKTELESLQLNVSKSNEAVKTPRQRKPTRFSPKSPEEHKLEDQLTKEDSAKKDETDGQKGPELSSPRIRKTARLSPKSLNLENIEVTQPEEYQPIKLKANAPTEDSHLKSDNETSLDGPLDSKILEKAIVPEPLNNSLSNTLKLADTPKKKRKPTRFSPKSPDKPATEEEKKFDCSEVILKAPPEVKKSEEHSNLSTSPAVLQPERHIKSPRVRKGTRFSTKSPDNLQIEQELSESKESQSATQLENRKGNSCVSEISEVANLSLEEPQLDQPAKLTRARKGTRFLAKGSENLQIEEELKKTLDDSQLPIKAAHEKPDVLSSSSSETKQETIKSSKTKKGTRFSLQAAQICPMSEGIKKDELQIKKASGEFEDRRDETTRASRQKRNTMTSSEQTNSITENDSGQISHSQTLIEISQESSESTQDVPGSNNSAPIKKQVLQEDTIKCLEQNIHSVVPSLSTPKPELTSKKGLKKQLQSMFDSLTSKEKVTNQKETTPRRKRKTLGLQQEVIMPAQDITTTTKSDELNQDAEMKVYSSDSNLSDDSIKLQDEITDIDQKHTSRRQLDSSFIDSLEKSLLRPISNKKSSKKKEKDMETVAAHSPKPNKEESKKSTAKKTQEQYEELKKKCETSSPKHKKKQPKGSPKMDKSHSEEQATLKRKNITSAKAKELEETKPKELESSVSDILNNSMTKQFGFGINQTPKTKAETKFFSPGKPSIQTPIAVVEEPVAPVVMVKEKSPDLLDPLKDIEKFIEDGVNLLKRCYKIDAEDDASLDRDILKSEEMMTPKKCKLDESLSEGKPNNSPPDDDNSNSNSESSTMTTNTSISEVDTPNGIRRSHRIKNNTKSTKFLVGRGLVRERERFSTKDDEKTIYSIDDQKMDLAEVEAKNSKFLKDMEERLSNFRVIRENEYKCERVISKEAKRMLCDCFLTQEEEVRGELGCGEDCLNRLLMIECGGDCTVRERCTNRRFNKFLYSPCRVFRTEKKGFGIMADIEILPGEFIMEYVGEVINGNEFELRINEYSKDKNKHYYFMALRSDAVIDATAKGNISRFINHSCDPNAETQKWTVNGELRIGFFSRKSIMPGEEITFDYQYQRYGKEAQRCYCESANCRGWIGAEPSSEEEEEYEGVDEEDESEESEEEEPTEAVVPSPVIPSPTPPIIAATNVEEQSLVAVVASEVPAINVEIVPAPQPVAVPTPLADPVPTEVPKLPKELPPKKKKEKKRLHEEKLKRREPKQFLEDPDIEDEVRFLVKCGLRNQADTLRLSRLIVRAKLLETRINLLQILRQGELPCRRLFLDYHGLRLLHGWMSEVIDTRDTEKGMEIRMELLSVLECLPISNKTMLTDSKVYQTVRDWSNNKESHSPSDGSPKEANANSSSASPTLVTTDTSSELQKLAAKLVHTWDNLPEVFRIPKRERIEQMKEHEREADRQYKVLGRGFMSGSDRNRNRERFMSKSGQKGRFKWSKEKERERANERRKYAQNNSSGKDGADKSTGSLTGELHLSKEQRRELFAAKVARDEAEKRQAEERREFDIKCRFFGLDPKRMKPENMPFCVNPSTGQWYSTDKKAISTPPSYAHVQVPVKPKSTNPEDYRLPEMDLPPLWKFAISPKGKIYYYHVKIRIPQWEPPIKILPLAGQHNTVVKNSESDSSTAGINDSSEDDIEVIKGLDPVKLQAYIEKKIEDRRLQRYNRLVEEKPISPRKEEDRIYNQMEVRKYKENKEKIRKRKEDIRRRGKPQDILDSSNLSETTEVGENVADSLPIQDYLLSSEEEEILKRECNNSPLIDKIVQGDKIVDELDALQRKRALKRSLPTIRDKYEHKKKKLDKNKDSSKSTKRNKDVDGSTSSSKYRKIKEKFRCEIAGIIVQHLKPYHNESCFHGKILTDDDFNHLARKLTHFVMVKELKYCESIGQTLIVTESVKNKSREFIKKYMAKYGKVYVRPKNDPEFKDIPFL